MEQVKFIFQKKKWSRLGLHVCLNRIYNIGYIYDLKYWNKIKRFIAFILKLFSTLLICLIRKKNKRAFFFYEYMKITLLIITEANVVRYNMNRLRVG